MFIHVYCLGATALPRMTAPTAEELGMAESVQIDELGDTEIVVFRLDRYISANIINTFYIFKT